MFTFSRRIKAIVAFIIVIVVGYIFAAFWQNRNQVPQDFTDARLQGATIAETIVNTSNQSTDQLAKINEYDQAGDYTDALNLTNQLITESEDLRNQAVSLSTQVGNMTKSLSSINSVPAQQAALESISSRVALINELVTYSSDLENLLQILQNRFTGKGATNAEVQAAVNQINTDVNAINNFNAQADAAMTQFDQLIKS